MTRRARWPRQALENSGSEKSICDALLSEIAGEITFPINGACCRAAYRDRRGGACRVAFAAPPEAGRGARRRHRARAALQGRAPKPPVHDHRLLRRQHRRRDAAKGAGGERTAQSNRASLLPLREKVAEPSASGSELSRLSWMRGGAPREPRPRSSRARMGTAPAHPNKSYLRDHVDPMTLARCAPAARPLTQASAKRTPFAKPPQPSPARGEGDVFLRLRAKRVNAIPLA